MFDSDSVDFISNGIVFDDYLKCVHRTNCDYFRSTVFSKWSTFSEKLVMSACVMILYGLGRSYKAN